MSFVITKNFSRPTSLPISSFIDSFEHRIISNISQRIPTIIIQTLPNLCEILDDYSLSKIKLEQIQQGTMDCILWNDDQSYPIAIDQNKYLYSFRQSIRELLHEFLDFAQEILIISDKKNQINLIIQKSMKYLILLNDYRIKRQSAYNYFSNPHTLEDAMLILINIDQHQFHELRFIALYLRQFFFKLITLISPKLTFLEE
jgi:hypothetical protein